MSTDTKRRLAIPARFRYMKVPAVLLALVLVGPAIYLDATIGGSDENIWAGMGMLWTAIFGLPWSLVLMNGTVRIDSGNLAEALYIVCALVNVLIVALLLRRRMRTQAGA